MKKKTKDPNQLEGLKQRISELEKAEEQYRIIAENTSDNIAITTFDLKAKYLYVSPSVKHTLGYKPEELLGRSFFDFIHPDDKKVLLPLLKKYIAMKIKKFFGKEESTISEIIEFRFKNKTGKWRYMQSTVNILRKNLLAITRDHTEYKLKEIEIINSEHKFRILTETAPIGIYNNDFKGKFLYGNKKAEEIIGYQRDELIGNNFLKLNLLNPKDLLKAAKLLALNKLGKSTGPDSFIINRKDGTKRQVEISTEIISIEGEKVVLGMFQDVTTRNQAQELLLKEKEYYRSFLSSLNDWAWEMDMNGIHTYSNSAVETVLGYKAEEIVGCHVTDFWEEKTITPNSLDVLNKALIAGKGWRTVIGKFKHKNGKIIITESTAIPTYNSENELAGYRGIDRDITKRIQAEEELQISKKRLKILNSILRHDITNDLAVIRSAINLYIKESKIEMLDEIKKRVDKSMKTIERQRKQESFIESHSILEKYKIEDVICETERNHPDIDITVTGKGTVYANEEIYSVFENLISNSIKHGNATKLNIIITSRDNICEIKVCDNGNGIPDEIKIKVFDKGFVHGKNGHTGLGLYIVKQTIENYAGYISVEDNEPIGTIFVIILKRVMKKYDKI